MHEQRRIAALQTDPQYLVLGIFKSQAAEDPGFPDKRWLTLDVMRATLEVAVIVQKLRGVRGCKQGRALGQACNRPPCISGVMTAPATGGANRLM